MKSLSVWITEISPKLMIDLIDLFIYYSDIVIAFIYSIQVQEKFTQPSWGLISHLKTNFVELILARHNISEYNTNSM